MPQVLHRHTLLRLQGLYSLLYLLPRPKQIDSSQELFVEPVQFSPWLPEGNFRDKKEYTVKAPREAPGPDDNLYLSLFGFSI